MPLLSLIPSLRKFARCPSLEIRFSPWFSPVCSYLTYWLVISSPGAPSFPGAPSAPLRSSRLSMLSLSPILRESILSVKVPFSLRISLSLRLTEPPLLTVTDPPASTFRLLTLISSDPSSRSL